MPRYGRPTTDEYDPYYAAYVTAVPEGDVLVSLERQGDETLTLLTGLSGERWQFRYAPGKWSVAEVLGHLCDTERVLSHRALRFARADPTPLPGFEQDDYVAAGLFDRRDPAGLLAEYRAVRSATLTLFANLPDDAPIRRGVANEVSVSVRALVYIIAGHERHHVGILKERYGVGT